MNIKKTLQDKNLKSVVRKYDEILTTIFATITKKVGSNIFSEINSSFFSFNKNTQLTQWSVSDTTQAHLIKNVASGNDEIIVEVKTESGKSIYIYTDAGFLDLPPKEKKWAVETKKTYQVHIHCKYGSKRPSCAVFIIFYDEKMRIGHKYQLIYNNLNKVEFQPPEETKSFRLAIKLSGEGCVTIRKPSMWISQEPALPETTFDDTDPINQISKQVEWKLQTIQELLADVPQGVEEKDKYEELLTNKLAKALYEKEKLASSFQYHLGKTVAQMVSGSWHDFFLTPKRLIKIRAAKKKGKLQAKPFNDELKAKLLESVGIIYSGRRRDNVSWPEFEAKGHKRNQHLNVVCITDKFTFDCFHYEANFIPLTKSHWRDEIDNNSPTMFFIESAWNGNDGEWIYSMSSFQGKHGDPLRAVIQYCKIKNIPVVFWNKEDPTNYDIFIDVAAECDYIFTTDSNLIEIYKLRVGHNRVYPLAFAAQPALHNPIRNKKLPIYDICFAGSWYNNGHDTRRIQTEIILDGILDRQLHIYDRMLYATKHRESRIFPIKYQPFIVGSLDYAQMITAYRQYKVFLNINTIQDSPTMFSRRVFEILACGTSIISTPSKGIDEMLAGHVKIVNSQEQTAETVKFLLSSDLEREAMNHQATRHCLQKHTYAKRFADIAYRLKLPVEQVEVDKVSTIMCTNRLQNIKIMIENYCRQLHKNKELIIILNNDQFNIGQVKNQVSHLKNTQVFQLPQEKTLGECLNFGIYKASGDYIAKMDDDDLYGPHYLTDSLIALNYSGADIVGKHTYWYFVEAARSMGIKNKGHDNIYTDFISGGTLIIRRHIFNTVRFHAKNRGEDTNFLRECKENGFLIYSSDKYNFIQMRHKPTTHTWSISDEEYLKNCTPIFNHLNTDASFI